MLGLSGVRTRGEFVALTVAYGGRRICVLFYCLAGRPGTDQGEHAMEMKVMYHDRCFDGACSASLFTRFHRECLGTASTYAYEGLAHKPGGTYQFGEFSGGENAIVDFKYSNDPAGELVVRPP